MAATTASSPELPRNTNPEKATCSPRCNAPAERHAGHLLIARFFLCPSPWMPRSEPAVRASKLRQCACPGGMRNLELQQSADLGENNRAKVCILESYVLCNDVRHPLLMPSLTLEAMRGGEAHCAECSITGQYCELPDPELRGWK